MNGGDAFGPGNVRWQDDSSPTSLESQAKRLCLNRPPTGHPYAIQEEYRVSESTYTLFYSPGSASMVVHVALLELGVPHQLKHVDFEKQAQRDPEYLRLNPQGLVPTLVVDGKAYFESAALLLMLAERHPESPLVPRVGTPEHLAFYQWVVHLSNSLASTFRFWFYPPDLGLTDPDSEASLAVKEAIRVRIEGIWDRLEAHVAANGPYLLGRELSLADFYLTMLMRWSRRMPRPATEWPALNALAREVRLRPSWKKLYELEGLTEWSLEG